MGLRGSKPGSTKETLNKALSDEKDFFIRVAGGQEDPAETYARDAVKRFETRGEEKLTSAETSQLTHLRGFLSSIPKEDKPNVLAMVVSAGIKFYRFQESQHEVKLPGLDEAEATLNDLSAE